MSRIVGVDAHVLRYWESEFRIRPHRAVSGQRLYRHQDVLRLQRIKELLHDQGYTIAGAKRVLEQEPVPVEDGMGISGEPPSSPQSGSGWAELKNELRQIQKILSDKGKSGHED